MSTRLLFLTSILRRKPLFPLFNQSFACLSTIKQANFNNHTRKLVVDWHDGEKDLYPYIFLRDNCQCSACFSPSALARSVLMEHLNIHGTVAQVQAQEEKVAIKWEDGHQSEFKADWLRNRSFRPEARAIRDKVYREEKVAWNANFQVPRVDFDRIINTDAGLLEWLVKLDQYGLVLVKNTPLKEKQLVRLCNRIAFPRQTNYGLDFSVKSKINANNLAYTGATLNLHVDLPFYQYMPGIQMLHCIEQAEAGGENQFVDSRYIGRELEVQNANAFQLLTKIPVDFYDVGTDYYTFHKVHQQNVLQLDKLGRVETICYNNQVRDSHLNIDLDQVEPFYEALQALHTLMYLPENIVQFKLAPGDTITFDNKRVLHGRTGYKEASKESSRHLEGIYSDWDEARSRIRVIRASLQQE